MSKIRVRSYLDGNAPQFKAAEKNGIIPFMKAMFEQESYGNIIPIGHQIDLVNNQLILEFDHNPGYSAGNLVQIVGSGLRSFTDNFFRVVSNDDARLYLKYDFNTLDPIPVDFDSTSLVVRHAPMDWEVLYSTDTQFSLRSKNENSSKNVITFKRPQGSAYDTAANLYCSFTHISKGLDSSTGNLIEDYFQKEINSIANNTESPFMIRVAGGNDSFYYQLALDNTSVKYPWFLIGDDKFFYLVLGNAYHNRQNFYMNFDRNPGNQDTRRCVYMFGDPDKILENDLEDPTGFIFNTGYYNPTTLYTQLTTNDISQRTSLTEFPALLNVPSNRAYDTAGCFFLRDFTNLPGNIQRAGLHTMSFNGGNYQSPFSYPGPFSHGIYFFPIYTSVMYSDSSGNFNVNTSAYLRSKLPWALAPFQSMRNVTNTWVDLDYSILKAQGKDILSIVTHASANVLNRAVHFELD